MGVGRGRKDKNSRRHGQDEEMMTRKLFLYPPLLKFLGYVKKLSIHSSGTNQCFIFKRKHKILSYKMKIIAVTNNGIKDSMALDNCK